MSSTAAAVLADLKRLRRGWGVHAQGPTRIGPTLTQLFGPGHEGDELTARVAAGLKSACAQLPDIPRMAAEVGLGLTSEASFATLEARLGWLAANTESSPRTALRRIDHALGMLARSLASRPADVDATWHFRRFEALLRLDGDQPEAVEFRSLVVTSGELSEIDTSISVPRHPDDQSPDHQLEVELLHGGQLITRDNVYESHFQQIITLSSPLRTGDEHQYTLRLRLPPGQPMSPHYVYVPHRPCESFDLRIRFNPNNLPTAVWRLDATPTAVIYEQRPSATLLTPDRFGEVRTSFDNLQIGLGFGICWTDTLRH